MAKAKPKMTNEDAQRLLADVPQDYVFRCCDGRILKNMRELMAALDTMTEETFAYHSNQTKSDFSKWVADVMKDDKLAADLAKSQNRTQAAYNVAQRIVFLDKRVV
ncbi:MAG: hypothetical protein NTU41_00140 [Chloroflexi bacterium]|nr:hypothetical protein [Chloroflexota bacterium]